MKLLESGEEIVPLVAPILSDNRINVENNIKVGEELGHDFFQRIWWYDESIENSYLSNENI